MMQISAHHYCFMHTQFCVDERTRRIILHAQKSVHANIKFVEPCVYINEIRKKIFFFKTLNSQIQLPFPPFSRFKNTFPLC